MTTGEATAPVADGDLGEVDNGRPVTMRAGRIHRIHDDLVWEAVRLIDGSSLVSMIEAWRNAGRAGRGGRPETFPMRALVVALLLCALTDQPMLLTTVRDILFKQISPAMRHNLGVPHPPFAHDRRGWDNCYRNVRTRFHRLLSVMDPSVLPKNRRLDPEAFAAETARRRGCLSDEDLAERLERLRAWINEVLDVSLRDARRDALAGWQGTAAVDATPIPAFARPARRERRTKKGVTPKTERYSADPDADWYHRDKRDDLDSDPDAKLSMWAYEANLVVSGSGDPESDDSVPTLVVGMDVLHKPGHRPGDHAVAALANLRGRGHPTGILVADRGYSQAKPEDFHLPARALGYGLVFDYKITQLGYQGSHDGMLVVDGWHYCPSMPEALITATKDFRAGKIDEDTWHARIEERRGYALRPKAKPDEGGHQRMQCPAAGTNPTARCPLKPKSEGPANKTMLTIQVKDSVREFPPKICTQQSVTLPPEAGAKVLQQFPHASSDWQARFATLRSANEGMNGFIKDGAHEAVDDPERRRVRGVAAQSVLVSFQLLAANFRKTEQFRMKKAVAESQKVRVMPPRRRTRSLASFAPGSSGSPTSA